MDLFKNQTFVKLFFAALASQMGTTIGNMAFAFYLLDHFSSKPFYAAIAEMMYSLPTLFVFFLAGAAADRFDRAKIAEHCDWIRALLSILLFLSLFSGFLPIVFCILFLRSAVTKFFFPAENSLVQGVIKKEQYAQAAGLNQILFSVFMIFGVGLGAAVYHTLGIHGAVAIDFFSFILSAVLIRLCKIPMSARLPNGIPEKAAFGIRAALTDFSSGIKYIQSKKLLTSIMFGFFVFGFFNGAFAILPMYTMKYKFSSDSYEWYASLFAAALGFGLIAGSAAGTIFQKKMKPHSMIIYPILAASIFIFLLGRTSNIPAYLSIVFLIGTCLGPVNMAIGGWMPKIVHPSYMGRVSGWIDPLIMMGQSLTLGIIALLFPAIVENTDYIYYGIGLFLLAVFFYFAAVLPKQSREAGKIDYTRPVSNTSAKSSAHTT
ncbi:MFS transporter [Metabacillus sp. GX 13764]|uniref:MFS transporter n=1 Tax=Metabacillus kandeliae TaxID=2900151 RepID=UPI001E3950F4|nr:MFS transporter [Metabacillus kandeliae]MCD7035459.1 MFS transporter [Metabacillus kandeliae]